VYRNQYATGLWPVAMHCLAGCMRRGGMRAVWVRSATGVTPTLTHGAGAVGSTIVPIRGHCLRRPGTSVETSLDAARTSACATLLCIGRMRLFRCMRCCLMRWWRLLLVSITSWRLAEGSLAGVDGDVVELYATGAGGREFLVKRMTGWGYVIVDRGVAGGRRRFGGRSRERSRGGGSCGLGVSSRGRWRELGAAQTPTEVGAAS
jgi:hypothetical protein